MTRIMIIEDNGDSLATVAEILQRGGFEVCACNPHTPTHRSVDEVISVAEEFRPDVILVDIGWDPTYDRDQQGLLFVKRMHQRFRLAVISTNRRRWGDEVDALGVRFPGLDDQAILAAIAELVAENR